MFAISFGTHIIKKTFNCVTVLEVRVDQLDVLSYNCFKHLSTRCVSKQRRFQTQVLGLIGNITETDNVTLGTHLELLGVGSQCQGEVLVQEGAPVRKAVHYDGVRFEVQLLQEVHQLLADRHHLVPLPKQAFHRRYVPQRDQPRKSAF